METAATKKTTPAAPAAAAPAAAAAAASNEKPTTMDKTTEKLFEKFVSLAVIMFFVVAISAILLSSKSVLTNITGANIGYFILILLFILFGFGFGFALFYFSSISDNSLSTGDPVHKILAKLFQYSVFFIGMSVTIILIRLIIHKVGKVSMHYSLFPAFIFTCIMSVITMLFMSFLYKGPTFIKLQTEGKEIFKFDKNAFLKDAHENQSCIILVFYLTFIPFFLYYNPFNWAVKYLHWIISATIIIGSILVGSVYAKFKTETSILKSNQDAVDASKKVLQNTNLLVIGMVVSSLIIYCIYIVVSKLGGVIGKSVGMFPQLIQIGIIVASLSLFYKVISSGDYFKHLPPILRVIIYTILYIPCLLTVCIDYSVELFAPGKRRTYMILIIMIAVFLILYFTEPLLEQWIILQKGKLLINDPIQLNSTTTLATYEDLFGPNPKLDPQYKKSTYNEKTNKYWGTIDALQESATTKTANDVSGNLADFNIGVINTDQSKTTPASADVNYEEIIFGKTGSSSGFLPDIFAIDSSSSGSSSSGVDVDTDLSNTMQDMMPSNTNYYKLKKAEIDANQKNLLSLSSVTSFVGIGQGSYNPTLTGAAKIAADQNKPISNKATDAGNLTDYTNPDTSTSGSAPGGIVANATNRIYKSVNTFSYKYGISFWVFLEAKPPSTNASHNIFASILSYGNKPNMVYRANTNTLRVIVQYLNVTNRSVNETYDTSEIPMDDQGNRIVYESSKVPIQEWVHFVINNFGGTMDIFMNNKLIGSADYVVPYMTYDSLTCGSDNGINGGICNIVFYKEPLTINQINVIYEGSQGKSAPTLRTFI